MDKRLLVTAAGAVAVLVGVQVFRWFSRRRGEAGERDEASVLKTEQSQPSTLSRVDACFL